MKILLMLTNRWWMEVELESGYKIVFTMKTRRSDTVKFNIYDSQGNIAYSGDAYHFPKAIEGHLMGMFETAEDERCRFFDPKDPMAYMRVRQECSKLKIVKVRSNFPV